MPIWPVNLSHDLPSSPAAPRAAPYLRSLLLGSVGKSASSDRPWRCRPHSIDWLIRSALPQKRMHTKGCRSSRPHYPVLRPCHIHSALPSVPRREGDQCLASTILRLVCVPLRRTSKVRCQRSPGARETRSYALQSAEPRFVQKATLRPALDSR